MKRSDSLAFNFSDLGRSFPRPVSGSDPCVSSVAGSVDIFSWFCVIDPSLSGSCPHCTLMRTSAIPTPVLLGLDGTLPASLTGRSTGIAHRSLRQRQPLIGSVGRDTP
jgi:hypothetical protein